MENFNIVGYIRSEIRMNKNKKTLLLLLCIVLLIVTTAFVKKIKLKTMEVNITTYEQGIDTAAFILQNENIISFKGANSIQFDVDEGAKISLNTVIGHSGEGNVNTQEALELDIINWKIENEQHKDENILNRDLEKINKELKALQKKIDHSTKKNKRKELMAKKEQLNNKKQIILGAFRYTFTDKKRLIELKDQLEKDDAIAEGNITSEKLGISYPGYVFFQRDGFESILHKDLIGDINEKYFIDILEYADKNTKDKNQYNNNEQVIKFIDDTKMYLIAKVPLNIFEEKEEKLFSLRQDLDSSWKTSGDSSLYSFVEKRKDILHQFPRIKIKYKDKEIWGYLLDINKDDVKDEKVATIKLDTNNHHLVGQRNINVYLYDAEYKGYLLPKSAVITKNKEKGVLKLNKNREKQFTKIAIKKELEDLVVLDPKENADIKLGDSILINP